MMGANLATILGVRICCYSRRESAFAFALATLFYAFVIYALYAAL